MLIARTSQYLCVRATLKLISLNRGFHPTQHKQRSVRNATDVTQRTQLAPRPRFLPCVLAVASVALAAYFLTFVASDGNLAALVACVLLAPNPGDATAAVTVSDLLLRRQTADKHSEDDEMRTEIRAVKSTDGRQS